MRPASSLRDALLDRVPDAPRTIEMRALLALAGTECHGNLDGAVIANAARRVIALVGDPEAALVTRVLANMADSDADADSLPVTALALHVPPSFTTLRSLRWKRATVMTLTDVARLDAAVAAARPHVVPLTLDHLGHVPRDLGRQLVGALSAGVVTCALTEDDVPASFAYASFETDTLFDISVDTLPEHRGHGHATRAAAIVIDQLRTTSRAPVWTAEDDNRASLAVARKLGLTHHSHLFVAHVGGRQRLERLG